MYSIVPQNVCVGSSPIASLDSPKSVSFTCPAVRCAAGAEKNARTGLAEHNVLWLEVAVDDAERVQVLDGKDDLGDVEAGSNECEWLSGVPQYSAVGSLNMPSRSMYV